MKPKLPQFLQKFIKTRSKSELVGISIHAQDVRLVKLVKEQASFVCSYNSEEKYNNDTELSAVLEKMIEQAQLADASVSIVLPGDKYQSTQIEQSEVPSVDAQAALPWQIKDLVNIPPQDMLCDYIDMPLQPFGQKAKAQVLATSRSYVEQIVAPFHERNIEIDSVTTEQFAIAKLQSGLNAAQLVFIQHRDADAILLILKNQEICFARKIRSTKAIVDMPAEQLAMSGSDDVAIEIQRSIDFYESQLKQPPIKNVLIAMDGNNGARLVELLNQALPVRTKLFPIDNIQEGHTLTIGYISTLGAALYSQSKPVEEEDAE